MRYGTERLLLLALPIGLVIALGCFWLRQRQNLLIDDSYIAFRYAANFADGHGLVWNPGERVEGYTNLLWVVLLSIISRLGLDLTIPTLALDIGFASATIVLLERISRLTRPDARPLAHLLPLLLLAGNASFAHTATSGMESTCFGFFVLLSQYQLIRGREEPRRRTWAALAFAAAYFTRPEGLLVCAIALSTECAALPGPWGKRVRALAPIALGVATAAAVHVIVRRAYYGYFLPNTFYAKVIFGHATILRGTAHVAGFLLAGGFMALPGILELERPGPLRPWVVHGYALFFTYCLYLVVVGGDYPFWYRFYTALLPLPLLATSARLDRVDAALRTSIPALGRAAWDRITRFAFLSVAAASTLLGLAFGELCDAAGTLQASSRSAMLFALDFFTREAPPGSLVAAMAVGHIGYYDRGLRILDMWGLNDPHIAHVQVNPSVKFGHDKMDIGYVLSKKPDYAYVLAWTDVPPVPGYDVCWPSAFIPTGIYRRSFPLAPNEATLGVPPGVTRRLSPPPPCLPAGPRAFSTSLPQLPPPPPRGGP